MQERFYPIGIQTFEKIRDCQAIYVDKTELIYRLVKGGNYYFLSRPRRFGKSLLISTLSSYFEGRKDLFEGLAIDKLETEWIQYPVLHFSLSRIRMIGSDSMGALLDNLLSEHEKKYGISGQEKVDYGIRLANLIVRAKETSGHKVVLLIDEYDAPLLDSMNDKTLYPQIRQQLRNFFSPIKDMDCHLQFVFITGITRYSQLSIFSELNNLTTITLNDDYASICGITREEVQTQLGYELEAFADRLGISVKTVQSRLKKKYDGYHFSRNSPDIYNPFSLLNALYAKDFGCYWYSTGTPTHVTEMLSRYSLKPEELEGFPASEMDFNIPIEQAETPIPVLYQSGYLTIKSCRRGVYKLGFPNEEVRVSFIKGLMPYYTKTSASTNNSFVVRLIDALDEGDVERAMNILRSFFSSIPYDAEKQDEDHYKTIFYLLFTLITEYSVRTEERSAAGRCDALIETDDTIYLFEFKLDGTAEEALKQIDDKGYAIQYEAGDKKIVKIGVKFYYKRRTIERWLVVPCNDKK